MAISAIVTTQVKVGGKTLNKKKTVEANGKVEADYTLAAAKTGIIDNWVDSDTAEVIGQANHGIQTGDVVDVYWSGGYRYGLTVGTVVGTTIPVDGGTGIALPADDTAVTIMKQQVEDFVITGSNLQALIIYAAAKAIVKIKDTNSDEYVMIFPDSDLYVWTVDQIAAVFPNPITGDSILTVALTHGSSAGQKNVQIIGLYN